MWAGRTRLRLLPHRLTSSTAMNGGDSLRAARGTRNTRAGSCFTASSRDKSRSYVRSTGVYRLRKPCGDNVTLCPSWRFEASGTTLRPARGHHITVCRRYVNGTARALAALPARAFTPALNGGALARNLVAQYEHPGDDDPAEHHESKERHGSDDRQAIIVVKTLAFVATYRQPRRGGASSTSACSPSKKIMNARVRRGSAPGALGLLPTLAWLGTKTSAW